MQEIGVKKRTNMHLEVVFLIRKESPKDIHKKKQYTTKKSIEGNPKKKKAHTNAIKQNMTNNEARDFYINIILSHNNNIYGLYLDNISFISNLLISHLFSLT